MSRAAKGWRVCVTTPSAEELVSQLQAHKESETHDRSRKVEPAIAPAAKRRNRKTQHVSAGKQVGKNGSPGGTALRLALAARQSASLFPLAASEQALIYGSAACTLRRVADSERYRPHSPRGTTRSVMLSRSCSSSPASRTSTRSDTIWLGWSHLPSRNRCSSSTSLAFASFLARRVC